MAVVLEAMDSFLEIDISGFSETIYNASIAASNS